MQVTNDLMNEHQLILKYIALMEEYVSYTRSNKGDDLFMQKAGDFISFIRNFADTFHHAKEEDILFRYMEKPGVLSHCNPLPQMLLEHKQGRQYVSDMVHAENNRDMNAFLESAMNYGQLLKEHIFKEDNILYPMAEEGISEYDKSRILDEYRKAEEKTGCQAIWVKFEKMYGDLVDSIKQG